MPSLNEMVYDVKNIAYGGTQSDDNPASDRQVAYWINQLGAVLKAQMLNKGQAIPDIFIQHLECIELECVDAVECCTVSSEEKILKSTQKIPVSIQRNGRNTILSVSSVDGQVGFTETTYFRQRYNKFNKYTGAKPRWFIKNDYLYVIHTKVLELVSLSGIFEDPTEVALFNTCEGTPCFTWDDQYPITQKLAYTITDMILKEKLGIIRQVQPDDSNDASGKTV